MVPFHSSKAGGNEGNKYKTNKIRDLALIYQGGVQRIDWTPDQFVPYVTHQFADGTKEWLFDGFLFLEFADGKGSTYAYGYTKNRPEKRNGNGFSTESLKKGKHWTLSINASNKRKKRLGNPASSTRLF